MPKLALWSIISVWMLLTIIPIAIAAFAAYGFAWMDFPGRRAPFIGTVGFVQAFFALVVFFALQRYFIRSILADSISSPTRFR